MRITGTLACTFAVICLGTAGCGSSPIDPTSTLEGTWTGVINDDVAGAGTAELLLTGKGPGVSGTWSARFADTAFNKDGLIGGNQVGSTISLFLTPRVPLTCSTTQSLSGTLSVTGTVAENELKGTYTVLTCNGATSGSLDLARAPN